MRILDAGCGGGRNVWFPAKLGCDMYGVDQNPDAITGLLDTAKLLGFDVENSNFIVGELDDLPYENGVFDVVICSAVLHFASSRAHFTAMVKELCRVCKPGGMIWFRMTTKEALPEPGRQIEQDIYELPDGTIRYLLDKSYLEQLMQECDLIYLDPFKAVNVDNLRSMCVACMGKLDLP
jgi:ubiquinone/menaquinone biosynthesis C-methylase UbiE